MTVPRYGGIVDAAVIGAGIVGLATGLAIARTGLSVLVIDPNAPGHGCSQGNAGLIATSEIIPLVTSSTMLRIPALLLDPLGPLAIPVRRLPALAPWFLRAARASTTSRRVAISRALNSLCRNALDAHLRLLPRVEREGVIRRSGQLDVIGSIAERHLLSARETAALAYGIKVVRLSAHDTETVEPVLSRKVAGGLLHPDVAQVSDPLALSQAYATALKEAGGSFVQSEARGIEEEGDAIRVLAGEQTCLARAVVIAAGIWSRELLKRFHPRIPVEAERGYHMQYSGQIVPLSRPVHFLKESFVATPLAGGLRLAGTAEFAGRDAPPNWARADKLAQAASRYCPDILSHSGQRWSGVRSTLPDSLPAIGKVAQSNIYYAFGHQHLGLTLAGVTAELIAARINQRSTPINLEPYSLERFADWRLPY